MDSDGQIEWSASDRSVSHGYDPNLSVKEILYDEKSGRFPKCPFCGSPVTATRGITDSGFVFCENCHRKMRWRILQKDNRSAKEIIDDGKV